MRCVLLGAHRSAAIQALSLDVRSTHRGRGSAKADESRYTVCLDNIVLWFTVGDGGAITVQSAEVATDAGKHRQELG